MQATKEKRIYIYQQNNTTRVSQKFCTILEHACL